MTRMMAREELTHLLGQLCKKCNEQVYRVPDKDQPTKQFMWFEGKESDPDDPKQITSTISYPSVPHPSGLCYFHLKEHENYFTAKFPLKGKVETFGKGGLSECPSSIFTSYGYKKNSRKRGRPAGL